MVYLVLLLAIFANIFAASLEGNLVWPINAGCAASLVIILFFRFADDL